MAACYHHPELEGWQRYHILVNDLERGIILSGLDEMMEAYAAMKRSKGDEMPEDDEEIYQNLIKLKRVIDFPTYRGER